MIFGKLFKRAERKLDKTPDSQSEQIGPPQKEDRERVSVLQARVRQIEISYSGPLPHPDILKQFEEVLPGSAQRIFTQFETQSIHRRRMEATVIASGAFSQRVGSVSSLVLGMTGMGGGIWLAHEGKDLGGFSMVLATLASLVGIYFAQRRRQQAELSKKLRTALTQRNTNV